MKNKKGTKQALLTSTLALLLCVSMLVGATFAWFTDSVTSGNNVIAAGNLDIELEYFDGANWKTVNGATDLFSNELWEPGHTEVVYLKMSNLGSLALKYQLGINIASETEGTNVDGDLFKLSDYIYMGVVENQQPSFASRDAAVDAVNGAGIISTGYSKVGTMTAGQDALYLAVVVYMPTWIGNEANHKTGTKAPEINLGINLVATQLNHENDSFGSDYDEKASVTVAPGESIANAIAAVEDGGVVFLENGVHNIAGGPIVIEGKTVTIIGLGEVTINKNYGKTHIFTVKNGANVTIENVTMDGKGNTREGIYVRWNSVVTLKNVVIKNTGGSDIQIDEASDVINGYIKETTASYVWLQNSHIEDIALIAAPTQDGHIDTYAYFNYDANSTVGAIDVQKGNLKPENNIINGVASTEIGKTMQLYVSNDAELAAALQTIKTNEAYWNKQVIVYLAAGEYSADHEINQYPLWNGIPGRNTGNNYQGGVPAGAPTTVITFVGETVSSYSLRGAQTVPAVTFTGKVTVNGFGDSGAGFASATAVTTFENVLFTGKNIAANDKGDVVALSVKSAASNVTFNGCVFEAATHISMGDSNNKAVGRVDFNGCTFNNGGCISSYFETLNIADCVVTAADNGFINMAKEGNVSVTNSSITAGKYFLRTSNSGVEVAVEDSDITMYEAEGLKHLVFFRGSSESAKFVDCTIADGYTTAGVDANSALEIYNYSETQDGLTLATDGITDEVTLYLVPSEYEGTTVNIPEGVDTIGSYAFYYNTNVETIVLPSTVTRLDQYSFRGTSATKVVLNEGLTEIGAYAFSKAGNLKEINFPSTVATVGEQAFRLAGFETLTIPATVTSIETGAFRDLANVTTITIEGNPVIANFAFRSCPKLTTVNLLGNDVTFSGTSQAFCRYDNAKETDQITFYVLNQEIANRLAKAQGSAKGYTVVCKQELATDENGESLGYYVDEEGNAAAYDGTGLDAALKSDEVSTVVLPGDIKFSANDTTANSGYGATGVSVKGGVLDGNGNTLTATNANGTWGSTVHTTGGTIKNITVAGAMRGIFTGGITSDLYIENVTFDDVIYTFSADGTTDACKDYGVYFTNCKMNGWTSYSNMFKEVVFTDCTFGEGCGYAFCRPYDATVFENCVFEEGFEFDTSKTGDIIFENCYYGDTLITAENAATLGDGDTTFFYNGVGSVVFN